MQVDQPLHELTSGENASRKRAAIRWSDSCQQVFDNLKRLCTTAPILAYADFTCPFKLYTKACGSGLGTVLYQTHEDGTDAVIAYASRSFTKAESHYLAHKLEFLAIQWAVVEKFHKYLYGSTFNIYTDNNPLMYFLTTPKLDAVSYPWVANLANYNFQLYYRADKTNIDTDVLLRVSWLGYMPDDSGTHLQGMAAVVWAMQEATLKGPTSPIEAYSCDLHILESIQDSHQVACISIKDWHQAQQADPTLSLVIARLYNGTLG